jgi:hypothetical protein
MNRNLTRLLVGLLVAGNIAAAQGARGAQPPAPRVDIPVTTVALFSSGVGYFEHGGTVRGSALTELRFRTSQMNDVLKSLVLQDQDGGRVNTIVYPSQDPLSKTLGSFQVDIGGNPSVAQLLTQLRGARVTIQAQAERIVGTVLGVENRRRLGDRDDTIEIPVVNVLTAGTIRSIELPSISGLTFDDPVLQDELTKALMALNQARDQDKKPVTIDFAGTGDRRVRVGYVVETPIWKTSYRLILDSVGARLQGWAIVENQTESDWNNVSLSLVSGRPISFMMDLYQPLYLNRPMVAQELFSSLRPQSYAGGLRQESSIVPPAAPAPAMAAQGGRGGGGGRGGAASSAFASAPRGAMADGLSEPLAKAEAMDAGMSIQSAASAMKLGELFQYTVGNVTLPRQKSAMLPIVTDSVGVERVSIFNAQVLSTNPLNGVRLMNTTGKSLLQGPLTVLEKGSYAGDARIDNLPAGQERLLSYGIDLDVLVDNTKNTSAVAVTTARIVKGVLQIDRRNVFTQDYLIDNKADREKTLVVEHPVRSGWTLVDSPKPYESTQSVHRFRVPAPARRATTLRVKEEITRMETLGILPANLDVLLTYSRTGEIPSAVRDALTKAVQLKQAVVDLERQVVERTQQITEISAEQERMRENMKILTPTTPYYQRLLAKLNEQESTIETMQKEREALIGRRDSARKEMEDYVSALTVR